MPTTSMNYSGPARIIVLFIKDSNKDDRLFITPDNETTGYYVTFEQNTILNKTENYVANQELVPYINNLFSAVQVDCDPYDCIQVDFPTYPTIIVERENLLSYLQIFAEQLSSVQAYWPSEISGNDYLPAKPGSREFEGPARLYFIFQKKGKKDDKLSIIPDAHGYKLCYDHADLFHTTERLIYSHELTSYLQLLSASLAFDAEPYEFVQVDNPMYPTVIVSVANFPNYTYCLLSQLESLSSWPTEKSGKSLYKKETSYVDTADYDWDVLAY